MHEVHVLLQVALAAADVRAHFALGQSAVEVKVQKTPSPRLELLVARAADVDVALLDGHVVRLTCLVLCVSNAGEIGRGQHFRV